MLRGRTTGEQGYSMVELMIAIFVILVGVLGTLTLIDRANSSTGNTRTREAGTSLARELVETTQGLPMANVTPSTINTELYTRGFPDDKSGIPGWQITRRNNVAFTVTATVCSVDDPSDGSGAHPSTANFCTDSGAGSGDSSPEDYKRVTFTVTPPAGTGPVTTQTTVVGATRTSNTSGSGGSGGGGGGGSGLGVTALDITAPTNLGSTNGQISQTCWQAGCSMPADTSTTVSPKAVTFRATTSSTAQKVRFTLDGQTAATINGPGTTFTWTWSLPDAQPDGTYSVAAQAVDSSGNVPEGDPKLRTVVVNRYRPTGAGYSPASADRNLFSLVPEIEWYPATTTARVDRDVVAFDVWRYPSGSLGSRAQLVMGTNTRWFADTAYPTPSGKTLSLSYAVWPSDYDNGGNVRFGTSSGQSANVWGTNPNRPVAPTGLTAARNGNEVTLNWVQSTTGGAQPNKGDIDASDCVDFYRVYRKAAGDSSGWVYANRVDRTPFGNAVTPCGVAGEASSSITLFEEDGAPKQYRITAVDKRLSESTLVAPTGACATSC